MKRLLQLLFFLMFWVVSAQEVEIGTGTSTSRFPLGNYYGFERSAALYTSAEMGITGNLSSIAWYAETPGEGSRPIKIYLKKITASTLQESTWSQMIAGAIEVYNSEMEPIEEWNYITFQTPFEIGIGENLLVLVEANYGDWGLTEIEGNSIRYSEVSGRHQTWMDDDFAPTEEGGMSPNRPNIKLNFGELPTCFPPSGVSITNVLMNSAMLSWDPTVSNNELGYSYEVRTSGEPGSAVGLVAGGTVVDIDDLPVLVEGLALSTTYYVYVKSNCTAEDNSSWSTVKSFSTPLVAASPWFEGFEEEDVLPLGWSLLIGEEWYVDAYEDFPPTDTFILNSFLVNFGGFWEEDEVAFSTIAVGPIVVGDSLSFNFAFGEDIFLEAIPEAGVAELTVELSTDFGTSYAIVGTASNNGEEGWQNFSYNLNDYIGQIVKIKVTAILLETDYGFPIGFDEFQISNSGSGPGPCPDIISFDIMEVERSSATINIESSAISFDIEYGEVGFEQGEGILVSGVSSPYQLTELEENTEYDVYVRANCGADNFGEWSDVENFTTLSGLPQTITVTDITKIYGDGAFIHGASNSELPLTYAIQDETVAEVVAGEIVLLKAGSTLITVNQLGDGVYQPAEEVAFTLTVNKAPLTVKATDVIKVYDNTAYVPSLLTYEGFVYEDVAADLSGEAMFTGSGNGAIAVGAYVIEVGGLISENYEITFEEGSLLINKANIEGVTFVGQTFTYDGAVKSIFISGDLPVGVEVTYENNGKTDVGDYTVIAEIGNNPNYNVLTLEAVLKIRNDLGNLVFEDGEFVYDGTTKSLAISGDLPTGVTVSYIGNEKTEAGEYTVTALIDGGDMYPDLSLTATLKIEKATLDHLDLVDGSFVYDDTAKSLLVAANTIPDGVTVVYIGNGQVNAGEYTITAIINGGNNYVNKTVTAELVINKAVLSGLVFNNGTFNYDGIAKFLVISGGALPAGVSVTYEENGKVDVGVYTVIADINGGVNYESMTMTATLTIGIGTIDWISLNDASLGYDGTAKSLTIVGDLPPGISVTYMNNSHVNLGVYSVTAVIDGGDNYHDLILNAVLTIVKGNINGINFLDATYVYDGLEKSLAISGTLPVGTSVSYQNNGHTDVGSYTVIATVSGGDNYNDAVLAATLRIIKASIEGVSFENATFVYDGTAKSIFINGTLPQGVTVSYQNNNRTNAGAYTVLATIHGGVNYANLELTATLTIQKIAQTITFNELGLVILEDTADFQLNAVASSGLPVSYTYTYNGSQPASISDAGWVTLLQSGIVNITAHQEGDVNHNAAVPVTRELVVESAKATIDELMINETKFINPEQEINYVVDCGAMVYELNFKVTTAQGIVIEPGATFVVSIPKAGIYRQTIKVTSANGKVIKEYNVIIDKPFEFAQIAHQKFDNTLLINNNPKTNGGYNFVGYQWFKNGELVGEGQVYSAGNNASDLLDPTASYHALLTTKEGDVIRVCPMTITIKGTRGVMLYPSPARVGETLTLQFSNAMDNLSGTIMDIYNMKGQLVYSKVIDGERTIFELPQTVQSGVYIAVMKIDNKQEVIKFIVE